jgi:hypothetical protein
MCGKYSNNWRKNFVFSAKGIAVCCAHNFELSSKFHTGSLSGIFPHAHVAVKNDLNFSHLRMRTLRGFFGWRFS